MNNNKPTKLAFIDIETTGLNRQKHEIVEIGLILVNRNNLEIIEEWDAKIKPQNLKKADPIALKLIQFSKEKWRYALEPKPALEQFSHKTADTILVAHNICFDRPFLEDSFLKWKVPIKWNYHSLDTISLAYYKLAHNQKLKLSEIARILKIEQKKAHSALDDAKTCYEIFRKLIR